MGGMSERVIGSTADGRAVSEFTMTNGAGMTARVITYGATLAGLDVPDRRGVIADVALGFDGLAGYLGKHPHFGGTVGRVANRIAKGRFRLDGVDYPLAVNNGPNHLHGGVVGFDRAVWTAEADRHGPDQRLTLSHVSPDGDEGYPGALSVTVTYILTDANELRIEYDATSDRPTVVNLTNHTYFNLRGHDSGDALDHELMIAASRYTPVDATQIPTGELRAVAGTPFDFRVARRVGERIRETGAGYDHNWVLDDVGPGSLRLCARLGDPVSGRVMEVHATQPGVQFYAGNFLDGTVIGKGGCAYRRHAGLCLETQHFPDSPNQPAFPTIRLEPSRRYRQVTAHRFSAR